MPLTNLEKKLQSSLQYSLNIDPAKGFECFISVHINSKTAPSYCHFPEFIYQDKLETKIFEELNIE
jgi:hypothetical protein